MAQYTKSVVIVLIALMLTGLSGYFVNTDSKEVIKTTYDYKGNLNPSVMYTKIDDWTEYNPLANVTGWKNTNDIHVPESVDSSGNPIANQYLFSPTVSGYKSAVTAKFTEYEYMFSNEQHQFPNDSQGQYNRYYVIGNAPVNTEPTEKLTIELMLQTYTVYPWEVFLKIHINDPIEHINNEVFIYVEPSIQYNSLDGEWETTTQIQLAGVYSKTLHAYIKLTDEGKKIEFTTYSDSYLPDLEIKGDFTINDGESIVYNHNHYPNIQRTYTYIETDSAVQKYAISLIAPNSPYPFSYPQGTTPIGIYDYSTMTLIHTYSPDDEPLSEYQVYGGTTAWKIPIAPTKSAGGNIWIYATFKDENSTRNYTYQGSDESFGVIPLTWYDFSEMSKGAHVHVDTDLWILDERVKTTYTEPTISNVPIFGTTAIGSAITKFTMNFTKSPYHDWIYDIETQYLYPAENISGIWDRIPYAEGAKISNLCYEFTTLSEVNVDFMQSPISKSWPNAHRPVYENAIFSDPVYADPTKFIEIDSHATGKWTNGEKNGVVEFLCTPYTQIKIPNQDVVFTCPTNTPYQYLLCTLDFLNGTYTCKGVTALDGTFNLASTQEYIVQDYPYLMGVNTTNIPKDVEGLEFYNSLPLPDNPSTARCKVYITNTTISVDPLGNLWGNPAMYLDYFFPDQMSSDQTGSEYKKQGTRVLFNGFVKTGSTFTINGRSFSVVDNRLIDPNNLSAVLPMKGMAVDYKFKEQKTYVEVVFTEASNYTISLGELNDTEVDVPNTMSKTKLGYVLSGEGTWYWQAGIYSLFESSETEVFADIFEGHFGLTMSASCLLMIFFIILIVAIMQFVDSRTEIDSSLIAFSISDWIILIATIVLLLVMASLF